MVVSRDSTASKESPEVKDHRTQSVSLYRILREEGLDYMQVIL